MAEPEMVEPDPEMVEPGDRFSAYYPLEILAGPDGEDDNSEDEGG